MLDDEHEEEYAAAVVVVVVVATVRKSCFLFYRLGNVRPLPFNFRPDY